MASTRVTEFNDFVGRALIHNVAIQTIIQAIGILNMLLLFVYEKLLPNIWILINSCGLYSARNQPKQIMKDPSFRNYSWTSECFDNQINKKISHISKSFLVKNLVRDVLFGLKLNYLSFSKSRGYIEPV